MLPLGQNFLITALVGSVIINIQSAVLVKNVMPNQAIFPMLDNLLVNHHSDLVHLIG